MRHAGVGDLFLCARQIRSGAMAVETGMGGRLDATNIVDPLVSVITIIELEHTEYLGNTIAAIAGEKAGIVKPGRPLVLARQKEEALEVFRRNAASKGSPLSYLPDIAGISGLTLHPGGTDFSLSLEGRQPLRLSVPLPGRVQAENAALAVTALRIAFPDLAPEAFAAGLARVEIPARFQRLTDDPPFILDGAHTPESIYLCLETFDSLYATGGILLFSCAEDKDVAAMAGRLLPCFSRVIVTSAGSFKASRPDRIAEAFRECRYSGTAEIRLIPDIAEALGESRRLSLEAGLPVLCAGSFYLASEVLKLGGPSSSG
ncbi:MAG: Mur ligase family protein [Treponema sp.]|nr:Mur ligase family protein [Treponema sp.]